MLIIRKPASLEEIEEGINLHAAYVADYILIPIDVSKSQANILKMLKEDFVRVIIKEGKMVGAITAITTIPSSSSVKIAQQNFFVSTLQGLEAVKAVIEAHRELIKWAETRKIKYIESCSGYFDEKNIFSRILESDGWDRIGYKAVWETGRSKHPIRT